MFFHFHWTKNYARRLAQNGIKAMLNDRMMAVRKQAEMI